MCRRKSKARLTGQAAGNGVGENLPMLIIEVEKPRCFKGVKTLPCQYKFQNVHPNVDNLKAIELVLLPPNTTSKTQPMDQGVMRALKAFYRTDVVRHQIKYIDAGKITPKINIL